MVLNAHPVAVVVNVGAGLGNAKCGQWLRQGGNKKVPSVKDKLMGGGEKMPASGGMQMAVCLCYLRGREVVVLQYII